MSKHTKGPAHGVTTFERLEGRTLLSLTLNSPEFSIAAGSAPPTVIVNTSTRYDNGEPAVAANARGDAVVVWSADGANGLDVYARRYAAGGAPLGDAFVVNSSLPGDQASADVALDAAGNFVISWTSRGAGPIPGVFMRQFNAAGQGIAGERLVAEYSTGINPPQTTLHFTRVAMTPDGRFAVAYDADDVYLRCYTADGQASGASARVSASTAAGGWATLFGVLTDSAGNYTVIFDNSNYHLSGRRFGPAAAPLTGIVDLRDATTTYSLAGKPATDVAGNVVVPWTGGTIVYARRYNADLTPAAAAFTVDTSASAPAAAIDPAGNLTIAYRATASPATIIKLKTYPSGGTVAPTTYRVVPPGAVGRAAPDVAATADGSVFLIDTDSTAPRAIYGRWCQGFTSPASLGDRVWRDSNANGVQDTFEAGVPSITVTLFDESGLEIAQTLTSSTGQYAFPEVMPGQRVYVQVTPSKDFFPTARAAGADPSLDSDIDPATWRTDAFTLAPNEARADVDAGLIPYATILATIFHDADRDGVKDADEPELSGWTIYADLDDDGQLSPGEPSTRTLTPDLAWIPCVRPGPVAIRVVPQPYWDALPDDVLTLKPGETNRPFLGLTTNVFSGLPRESGARTSVAPSTTAGPPRVAVDGHKRIILVWGAGANIYFQRLASDAARTPLAPAAVIQTGINIQDVRLSASASGDFLLAWQTNDPRGTNYAPLNYLCRFDAEGRPKADPVKVTFASKISMAMLDGGGYLIARTYQGAVTAERYASDGSMIGAPIPVSQQSSGSARSQTIAADATGAFIVAWDAPDADSGSLTDRDVYARLFAADGTPVTDEMHVTPWTRGTQAAPVAAAAGDGHFVVTWAGSFEEDSTSYLIQSQRFDRTGRVGGETVGSSTGTTIGHDVTISPSGDFAVVYYRGDYRIQYYTAAGAPTGPLINLSSRGANDIYGNSIAMDADGDIVASWQELSSRGVLMRRFVVPPAATLAPTDPSAAPSQLRLRFSEPLSPAPTANAVRVENLTAGRTLDPSEYTWSFDPATQVATFNLLGLGTTAADGNYRLTLPATAVTDTAGNPMTADVTADFFALAGDATRDRTVNFDDLLALAKNYNKTGMTFPQGDFTGDGVVNFDDLLVLAKNYNKTLPAAGAAPTAAAAVDVQALAAAMGIAAPAAPSTTPTAQPPTPQKKPAVTPPKPAPRPTPPAKSPAPPATRPPTSTTPRKNDKANPLFSTTPVARTAAAKPKAPAKPKAR